MPIFGESASPYDEIVEKVTAETLTSENWEVMIDICDRVNADGPKGSKQCLLSVKKRLNHRDPHVVLFALSLLDCLWNNCGQKFRREVSSKEFIGELSYKCSNSNRVVAEKTRSLIKKWAENECKQDSSLSLVESLYKELLDQGFTFEPDPASNSNKKKAMFSSDPNAVSTDQEEADIAKAIALSLQESGTKKQQQSANSYPTLRNNDSFPNFNSSPSVAPQPPMPQQQSVKQVRALYDFEAAEDNEISFSAGDIINVQDDSDQNWWRGSTGRGGVGLFPSSFVTTDLADPGAALNDKATEVGEADSATPTAAKVQIDENVLLKCIELLEGLDPALDASSDPPELAFLENMAIAQAPLIDQKLMQIDKQLNQLADVDLAIRDVLGAYDSAVQRVATTTSTQQPPQVSTTNVNGMAQQQMAPPIPPNVPQPQMHAGQWQQSSQQ